MGRNYAEALTKEYLQYLGITKVSEDGKEIWKGDLLLPQFLTNSGHLNVGDLYDPLKRLRVPLEERTTGTGNVPLGVHRIVYAWYNNFIPNGLIVHHLNHIKTDNRLENLELRTPGENIWDERVCNIREKKCRLDKPREFYTERLREYEEAYAKAKIDKLPDLVHKYSTYIADYKAKLRYYDSHIKEKELLEKDARDLEILKQYKNEAKNKGDKELWHILCAVIKDWSKYPQVVKEETMKNLLGGKI